MMTTVQQEYEGNTEEQLSAYPLSGLIFHLKMKVQFEACC